MQISLSRRQQFTCCTTIEANITGDFRQISQEEEEEELHRWVTEVSTDMCYWCYRGKDLGCLLEVVTYSDAEKSSGTNFPFFNAAVHQLVVDTIIQTYSTKEATFNDQNYFITHMMQEMLPKCWAGPQWCTREHFEFLQQLKSKQLIWTSHICGAWAEMPTKSYKFRTH